MGQKMKNRSKSYEKIVSEFGTNWAHNITVLSPIFKAIDRIANPDFYNYGFGGDDENVFPETIKDAKEWAKQTKKLFLSLGVEKAKEIVAKGDTAIYCGDGWWMPVDFELSKVLGA